MGGFEMIYVKTNERGEVVCVSAVPMQGATAYNGTLPPRPIAEDDTEPRLVLVDGALVWQVGKTADEIIRVEEKVHKNDPARLAKRIDALCENWDKILQIIDEELPDYEMVYNLMKSTGMPVEPEDLDIPADDVVNAYLGARDIRDKYLSCSFLWDMGLEKDAAQYLRNSLN